MSQGNITRLLLGYQVSGRLDFPGDIGSWDVAIGLQASSIARWSFSLVNSMGPIPFYHLSLFLSSTNFGQ